MQTIDFRTLDIQNLKVDTLISFKVLVLKYNSSFKVQFLDFWDYDFRISNGGQQWFQWSTPEKKLNVFFQISNFF